MQTCPECGSRNEDGELFCGGCGAYLEWEETRAAEGAAQPEEQAAEAPPEVQAAEAPPEVQADALPEPQLVPEPGPAPEPAVSSAMGSRAAPEPALEPVVRGAEPIAAVDSEPEPPETTPRDPAGEGGPATGGAGPATAPAAPAAPEPAPTGPSGARAGGAMRSRARRMVRQSADRATGGAVSAAGATASRARSAGTAPGRAGATALNRAAGGAAGAAGGSAAATAAARAATRAPAAVARGTASPTRPASTKPAPTKPAPTQPAPTKPAPAGQPAPRRPEARQPGAPVPRRPPPAGPKEEPPPKPGELICGACGAGNAPHRNFCRRCGAGLADAAVQPQRSWWRRVLRPDPKPGPAAGTRPRNRRRRRFPTGLVVTLLVLALAGGAVWYFREPLRGTYESVLDRVAGNDPIYPTQVRASTERVERPASQAADGVSNRAWSPEGEGTGEWIEFELDRPRRLVTVLVTAGNGLAEEDRLVELRPERVRLTMTTPGGERIEDLTLPDSGEPYPVSIGLSDVTAVRLTIQSVHGAGQPPVSVAEVEFRGRG